MQISDELLEFWSKHKEWGDASEIGRKSKRHPSSISRILSGETREAPLAIVIQINDFYKKRKALTKKVQPETEA